MANSTVDNIIALRILYALVKPFDKTEAYKLGVIDKNGTLLIKSKDQTPAQKNSYDMLDRLVFSLKRLLSKIPGGQSQIATLAAAYYLVKESYESGIDINEEYAIGILTEDHDLQEECLIVENFLNLQEEMGAGAVSGGIANRVGPVVSTDEPAIHPKRKSKYGLKDTPSLFKRVKRIA